MIFIFIVNYNILNAQDKISITEFNGIWKNIEKERIFYIIKDNEALFINKKDKNIQKSENVFYIDRFGFCEKFDSIEYKCNQYLKESLYTDHICIEGQVFNFSFDYPVQISSRIEIIGNGVSSLEKVDRLNNGDIHDFLSSNNIKILLKKFLNRSFEVINIKKSIIHSRPSQPTKMYLIQNDPVEVVEERDDWLRIKYYPEKNGEWTGKVIEGWIKKSDVE